jgi:hypothetical protein
MTPLSPNKALQRSWTHKLQGRGRLVRRGRVTPLAPALGRRAAAERGR